MRRVMLSLVLGLLGFGLLVTSVAMAASSQPPTLSSMDSPLYDEPVTDPVSPTTTVDHPVASAMADFFSETFDFEVDSSVITGLHDEGYGFGVIAKVYFVAGKLGGDVTPEFLLGEFDSGKGWGVIMKDLELHPGIAGRGGNLGTIMSTRNKDDAKMPPGQLKKMETLGSEEGDTFVPPGQLKKSGGDDDQGPPGKAHGKGKAKGKK